MPWQVSGRSMELCNCKMLYPCGLGPDGEPDEGLCGAGRATKVPGAAAQAGFAIDSMGLAGSEDSSWSNPDLRRWQGDSGTLHKFDWSG